MRRFLFAGFIVILMLLAGPVSAQDIPQPAAPTGLADVALPPPLDRVLRDYERAWSAGDSAALSALFAEDGFILQSNRPPIRGRASIRAAYAGQASGALRLRALAFATADTVGYIIGEYGYGSTPGNTGKFTLTLRREPGGPWLIFSDMDNPSASPQRLNVPNSRKP